MRISIEKLVNVIKIVSFGLKKQKNRLIKCVFLSTMMFFLDTMMFFYCFCKNLNDPIEN